jgi:transposase
MRDQIGVLWQDEDFAGLFPTRGQPALAPWRLALVTVMQFAENLSDRQAAEAVRARIDWKYALGLELTDPGFDFSVLSEFRSRLLSGGAEDLLLGKLLEECANRGLVKSRGRQRTDSTHVVAAIRTLNRLECVGETMRAALNALAAAAPGWLAGWAPREWYERYGPRFEEYRLPKADTERRELADAVGEDGFRLLGELEGPAALASSLREIPAIGVLERVWAEQYHRPEGPGGPARWKGPEEMPPAAETVHSPYDTEAHYSWKRDIAWTGYKVHLTETYGDEDLPHLITHVETVPSTAPDVTATNTVHAALSEKGLAPAEHVVDAGYVGSEQMVEGKAKHGVDLIGPAPRDPSWQARTEGGLDISHFAVDWESESVRCPQGKTSRVWRPTHDRHGNDIVTVAFGKKECLACPSRSVCTRSKVAGRGITLRPRAQHEALQAARKREATEEFQESYDARAGVEGTLSQGIRVFGLRRTRYIGQARTHLQHVVTAVAINLVRLMAWLCGTPRARTRQSRFARLAPCAG